MHFYGRAEESAKRILSVFQSGDVPAALARVFIHRMDTDTPCRKWSWNNQLITALMGFDDARGFRQWEEVGRHVRKGQKGFPILVPCHVKREVENEKTGQTEERPVLVGFKHCIVFGYEQTDGEALPEDQSTLSFIEALPLVDVARSWGLTVKTFNGAKAKYLGYYRHNQAIRLGVAKLATWSPELVQAADDRLGNLTERGQHWRSETVAELGGAILLDCMGLERDADAGGCWEYVSKYAEAAQIEPLAACQRVLKRTCDAVALILSEYDRITTGTQAETVQAA